MKNKKLSKSIKSVRAKMKSCVWSRKGGLDLLKITTHISEKCTHEKIKNHLIIEKSHQSKSRSDFLMVVLILTFSANIKIKINIECTLFTFFLGRFWWSRFHFLRSRPLKHFLSIGFLALHRAFYQNPSKNQNQPFTKDQATTSTSKDQPLLYQKTLPLI